MMRPVAGVPAPSMLLCVRLRPTQWLYPGLFLLLAFAAAGHRLDEYLQAARVTVDTDHIDFDLDLTPGVAVANRVLALLDTNADGRVTPAAARAYATRVLQEIHFELDHREQKLRLLDIHVPSVGEMREGVGVIQLAAGARELKLRPGPHRLTITNHHESALSVYMVNALVPRHPAIHLTRQSRDETQQGYQLDFQISTPPSTLLEPLHPLQPYKH
jgi:hypothetical protein